ncbi:SAG family member [Eimeria mitis]|uniref:SAG family member n=1 Tax=Eimeria mitis TaxID=44415 RepID=U6JV43_9EIME|nr:SAG family member [Eimeria mitis]CDJ27368.1 SAG family member [Eimeria mitis]
MASAFSEINTARKGIDVNELIEGKESETRKIPPRKKNIHKESMASAFSEINTARKGIDVNELIEGKESETRKIPPRKKKIHKKETADKSSELDAGKKKNLEEQWKQIVTALEGSAAAALPSLLGLAAAFLAVAAAL